MSTPPPTADPAPADPAPADPAPADPAPAALLDEALLDEALLDEAQLDSLMADPSASPPPAALLPPAAAPASTLPDERDDVDPAADLLLNLASATAEGVAEEDLAEPPDLLVDEHTRTQEWLSDDGLSTMDEDDLQTAQDDTGAALAPRAGVEERVTLVDVDDLVVNATLATGMPDSVLSLPLTTLADGRIQLQLGRRRLVLDSPLLSTALRLGDVVIPATLHLVKGPSLRLVLGRDLLAGRVLVDPAATFVLTSAGAADRTG